MKIYHPQYIRMSKYLPAYKSQKVGHWVKTVYLYITKEQKIHKVEVWDTFMIERRFS